MSPASLMLVMFVEAYPDSTRQRHQMFILEFYGFLPFNINTEATLTLEIAVMARTHLNPILKALVFEPAGRTEKLIAATNHFKIHDDVINDQAPVDLLDADKHCALTRADGSFRPSLYKVFLFQHIAGAIRSGNDVSDTDPLHEIFPQRHDVPLAQVLETIDQHRSMLNSFEHWQQTHTRQSNSYPTLLAGIMGLGGSIGVRNVTSFFYLRISWIVG